MFILNKPKEKCINYPKYLILLKCKEPHYIHNEAVFYYLISSNKHYTSIPSEIPNYLIILDLFFDRYNKPGEKFDLSKLAIDFIFNKLCLHYRSECTGSYPDNYIFVNEPVWPIKEKEITVRTPLKRRYYVKD